MKEVIDALQPHDGGIYVDATFGAGGYTRALLSAAQCSVWAIDRDPDARRHCEALEKDFPNRVTLLHGRFGDMTRLLQAVGANHIDGVAIDLGVSSMQIDDPARGFSFRFDGPLDMRMEQDGMSAADVVNTMGEQELADIIYQYGEERASRKVARVILEHRETTPFTRTAELADIIRKVVRKSKDGIDPATRTFQALRIYVNDELGEVERGLAAAEAVLAPGGRLAVVSFHVLKAEWSYLNEPQRLSELARTYLGASNMSYAQINGLQLIPMREPSGPESLNDPPDRLAAIETALRELRKQGRGQ
jgi:16S rRNA (cytosine1402-N4)-methyltransferase